MPGVAPVASATKPSCRGRRVDRLEGGGRGVDDGMVRGNEFDRVVGSSDFAVEREHGARVSTKAAS